jgi:curved DNA-binding protein CbpA
MVEERNHQRIDIKEGIDWSRLDLEPIEAFILSRVEKGMTLDDIFYISGLSKEETCKVIQSLVNKNILFVEGFVPQRDESGLSVEEREKIDRFYNNLSQMNYYQILGVPFDAPLRVIKQQFYYLSKEYHPDRYFKKNIGEYKNKLEEIFKKIREAYEVLSDNVSKEIYKESTSASVTEKGKTGTGQHAEDRKQVTMEREEKLTGAKESHTSPVLSAITERIKKAKSLFEEGMKFYNEGNFQSALNSFKLSVAYDPFNKKYKEMLAKADAETRKKKIKIIIEQAEIKDSMGETDEAIGLLEEAVQGGCDDAIAYHNLAKLYLKKGENLQIAKNYCLKAMELNPRCGDFHVTLGQIYTGAGLIRNARREFEQALSLQPDNQKIKLYLEELKRIEYGKK